MARQHGKDDEDSEWPDRSQRPDGKAEVTRLLKDWRGGRREALDELLQLVYKELRQMARRRLAHERRNHTLQATELVNEAALRLLEQRVDWKNRLHFFAIAANCMRRILMDHARRKRAAKRPPAEGVTDIENLDVGQTSSFDTLLAIDEALTRLAVDSPRQAEVAELKLFGGLEVAEIAALTGVSEATVKRDWSEAKKLLSQSLTGDSPPSIQRRR